MITTGSGEFVYRERKAWGKLPEGWQFDEVADVATGLPPLDQSGDYVAAIAGTAAGFAPLRPGQARVP